MASVHCDVIQTIGCCVQNFTDIIIAPDEGLITPKLMVEQDYISSSLFETISVF